MLFKRYTSLHDCRKGCKKVEWPSLLLFNLRDSRRSFHFTGLNKNCCCYRCCCRSTEQHQCIITTFRVVCSLFLITGTYLCLLENTVSATFRSFNKFWSRWLENESRRLWRSEGPTEVWNLECLWCIFQQFGQEITTLRALLSKSFLPSHCKDILKNVQNVWRILLQIYRVIFSNVWHLFYE